MRGEHGGYHPEGAEAQGKKFDRAAVEALLERGEKNLEGRDLRDLDLAELDLEGASFRRADVRGMALYRLEGEQTKETNIRRTDWTDATFADLGPQTVFQYVNAEQAAFGFSETLVARRKRLVEAGKKPTAEDSGGYHNFDGRGSNFRGATWRHVDFGGEVDPDGTPVEGYEALFAAADLSGSLFEGVSLEGIDWTAVASLDGVTVKDPDSLAGLAIRAEQVPDLAAGITLSDPQDDAAWQRMRGSMGDAAALRERFGVLVLPQEEL